MRSTTNGLIWQPMGNQDIVVVSERPLEMGRYTEQEIEHFIQCHQNELHKKMLFTLSCRGPLGVFPRILLNLENMYSLTLRENGLATLPEDLYRLVNLRYLDVRDNMLIRLPHTLDRCLNLQSLNACNNRLRALPPTLIHIYQRNSSFTILIMGNPEVSKYLDEDHQMWFTYRRARASTVALLALSRRKTPVIHKDVLRHVIAPMLYETRADEEWENY